MSFLNDHPEIFVKFLKLIRFLYSEVVNGLKFIALDKKFFKLNI